MTNDGKRPKLFSAIRVALADAARDLMTSGYFTRYTVAWSPDHPSGRELTVSVEARDLRVWIAVEFKPDVEAITEHRTRITTNGGGEQTFKIEELNEARDAVDELEIALKDAIEEHDKGELD